MGRSGCVICVIALTSCRPVPPPPLIPMHAGTEAEPRGSTTAMLVVGVARAGDFLFSGAGGLGVALRVEHQQTNQTALGVQLGGGRGDEGTPESRPMVHHTLVALEGYGRRTLADWTAATYGAGVSWFDTGLWTLSAHAGLAVSVPNDYAVPVLRLGVAGVVPIVPGRPFGSESDPGGGLCLACEHSPPSPLTRPGGVPTSELFLIGNLGVLVPITGGNRVSLDLGLAHASEQTLESLSIADAQR